MNKFYLLILIFISSNFIFAQQTTIDLLETGIFPEAVSGGNVNITQDQRLQTIINNHIAANKERPLKGYRVQIYFGSGAKAKGKAEILKKEFLTEFSDMEAYLEYDAPYFKVKVGNFRSKMDAEKFKKTIETDYEKIFVVEEEIEFPEL
jgi:hypothetical protein